MKHKNFEIQNQTLDIRIRIWKFTGTEVLVCGTVPHPFFLYKYEIKMHRSNKEFKVRM